MLALATDDSIQTANVNLTHPPALFAHVTYNPLKNQLNATEVFFSYTQSKSDFLTTSFSRNVSVLQTSAPNVTALPSALTHGTASDIQGSMWGALPDLSAYIQLDDNFDSDEIHATLLLAQKKLGW